MLKTLIKKQFREIFRNYYVNSKTGKSRSQKGVTGMIIGYAVIMGFLAVMFAFFDFSMGLSLMKAGRVWLYFSLNAIGAVAFGTLGSVFSTYSSLYIAKDNEQLLSLPIPPQTILLSRLTAVYAMSALYSGVIWLPSVIVHCILGGGVVALIMGLALMVFLALFVTVLTAILGWIVAAISVRLKGKSYITAFIGFAFFGLYYFFFMRSSNLISSLVDSGDALKPGLMSWGYVFYQLALGACGDLVAFGIFAGITLILFGATLFVLSKSFIRIVTTKHGGSKAVYREREATVRSQGQALFRRELKRFTSSATYMMNAGFGLVMEAALGVLGIVFCGTVQQFLNKLLADAPAIVLFIAPMALAAFIFLIGTNYISTPSVSLEGDRIWVVHTLPVRSADVLRAKLRLHIVLNAVPAMFLGVVAILVLRLDLVEGILLLLCAMAFIALSGAFGLFLGLKNPNLHWTVESQPIKQGMAALIGLFGTMLLAVAVAGIYFLLVYFVNPRIYLAVWLGIFVVLFFVFRRWVMGTGAKIFEELS